MQQQVLLTRDIFRTSVFERDGHTCVCCGNPAVDAHHVLERRLFSDGGYYINNGVSLCSEHHLQAEQTTISVKDLRRNANISEPVLPDHFYHDCEYDKWGNIIMPNGDRLRGELYYEEGVQRALEAGGVLYLFSKYIKYPRTYHVPWSAPSSDDRVLDDDSQFTNREVVGLLKMDGENTTMYNDFIHARSINSGPHPSRSMVKSIWSKIAYLLDDDMRVCGENLYAQHTVAYDNLSSYFMVFNIWVGNTCLSWDETVEYCGILGLESVPVFYRGVYDAEAMQEAFKPYADSHEGCVIRVVEDFPYSAFKHSVAKYVQKEFKEALDSGDGKHWMSKKVVPNKLKANQ